MKYLDFLKLLLSFGPKLPSILASIERIITVVTEEAEAIRVILGGEVLMKSAPATEEELALEAQVAQAAYGEGKFGGPLQKLLEFVRNNPELIQLLLLFLKK